MTAPFRCGIVAIVGRPNAGKSTLLNALLGQKLAITAMRAQTTRGRILGVLTRPEMQVVFHDTPGLSRGQTRFHRALAETALRAAEGADLRLLLFPCGAIWDTPEERLAALPGPTLLVHTQRDRAPASAVPDPGLFAGRLELSALAGTGLEPLLAEIARRLPESPPLYGEDYLTDRPLRFLAAEQIREVAFEQLEDELPYALAVEVEEWHETEAEVRVRANLLVERDSQKGIVVGAGGSALGRLGREARARLARELGKPVHLKLWVKTDRHWSRRPKRARELGYLI